MTDSNQIAHSPTPWEASTSESMTFFRLDGSKYQGAPTSSKIRMGNESFVDAYGIHHKANAEHIVRCVNSHEALVNISKDEELFNNIHFILMTALEKTAWGKPQDPGFIAGKIMEEIEQALRLAEGGE